MKKVLFATTALVASAGVAAADVNLSGLGRFGIGYLEDRSADPNVDDTILVSRFRVNIDADAETDGGVEFSARVRLQQDEDAGTGEAGGTSLSGARFSVIFGGLRVDAGNVSGALDNLANYYGNEPGLETFVGQYSGVNFGLLAFDSTGPGANAVFFNYSVGDFGFAAGYDTDAATGNDYFDVSLTYTFNNITAALGYGDDDDDGSLTVLTLGAEFGDFSGTLFVADDDNNDASLNGTAYGLSAAYNLNAATTLTFAYGDGNADGDTRNVGIGAIYDLGGGVSLRGGIGEIKTGDADGQLRADFGAQFDF